MRAALLAMEPRFHYKKANSILFKVEGPPSLNLREVNEVAKVLHQRTSKQANTIFGVSHNPDLEDEVVVTLLSVIGQSQTRAPGPALNSDQGESR